MLVAKQVIAREPVRELMEHEGIRGIRALLDVNRWVTLFDDAHVCSVQAKPFIEQHGTKIAACPLTENGVIGILKASNDGRRGAIERAAVCERLRAACDQLDHEFWPTTCRCATTRRWTARACTGTRKSAMSVCWRWP